MTLGRFLALALALLLHAALEVGLGIFVVTAIIAAVAAILFLIIAIIARATVVFLLVFARVVADHLRVDAGIVFVAPLLLALSILPPVGSPPLPLHTCASIAVIIRIVRLAAFGAGIARFVAVPLPIGFAVAIILVRLAAAIFQAGTPVSYPAVVAFFVALQATLRNVFGCGSHGGQQSNR